MVLFRAFVRCAVFLLFLKNSGFGLQEVHSYRNTKTLQLKENSNVLESAAFVTLLEDGVKEADKITYDSNPEHSKSEFVSEYNESRGTSHKDLSIELNTHSNSLTVSPNAKHVSKRYAFPKNIEAYLSNLQDNTEDIGKKAVVPAVMNAFSSVLHQAEDYLSETTNIITKIEKDIEGGMKTEAAILDAALPMLKELLHTPGGIPGSSQLSMDKVLDHQSQCAIDFERSVAAFIAKKRWASKLFDAWGKIPPGVLREFSIFRGEYKECREIRAPPISVNDKQLSKLTPLDLLDLASLESLGEQQSKAHNGGDHEEGSDLVQVVEGTKTFPAFRGKFCHVGVAVKGAHITGGRTKMLHPPVTIGAITDWCVPSSCSESQISDLWNHTFTELTRGKHFKAPLEPIPATCQDDLPRIEGKTIGMIIVMVICILGQGACTFYDVWYIQKPKWRLRRMQSNFVTKGNDLRNNTGTVQTTHAQSEHRAPLIECENQGVCSDMSENLTSGYMASFEPKLNTFQQVIQVFSLYTNGQRLLNTQLAPRTLTCVHGIRAISMAWIVLGHSLLFTMPVAENIVDFYLRERKVIYSMVITNGPFAVDTFFILSGIMVGYTFTEIYQANTRLKYPVFVLYRFFRLSPSMVIVGAVYICLWPALGSGPAYPTKCPDEEVCSKYWYYSVFFVNTLVDTERKCMGWTWYLSVDFQLYLMSPLLLVPMVRGWKKTGMTLALIISLGFVVVSGVISHKYKMAETVIQTATEDGGPVNVYNYLDHLYFVPWSHVAPYITGLMMGYHFKVTERRAWMPKIVVILGWTLSTAVALFMVFGMYNAYSHRHLTTVMGAAIYNALKDAGFSLAVAWVIYACVTGYGGIVNSILSWKAFIMISRVTYCMYLVHIPILFFFAFTNEGTVWWTESYLIINWLGVLIMSTIAATIISLTTEAPSLRTQKLILTKLGFHVTG